MVLDNVPAQIPRNSQTQKSGLPPHDISAEEVFSIVKSEIGV